MVSFIMDGFIIMFCKSGTLKLWDPILYGSNFEVKSNFVWLGVFLIVTYYEWFQILDCDILFYMILISRWFFYLYGSNFEVFIFGVTIFCMFANVSLFSSVIMWNHKGVKSNYVWFYHVFSLFFTIIFWNFETMISNSIWLCCNCL